MANPLSKFQRQIRERFLADQPISITDFYGRYPTDLLLRLQAGWERDFDEACGGDPYRQPKEWLQDRLHLIARILDDRNHTPAEKMDNSVRSKLARPVTQPNHR